MSRTNTENFHIRLLALVATLGALALLVTLPATAEAQGICQQYPDNPACLDEGGTGADPGAFDPDGTGFGPGAGTGTGTGSDSGNLPFTGYPLTPLILLLLALLAIGLAVRAY